MDHCTPEFEAKHLLRYHHGDSEDACIEKAIELFVRRQKAGSLEGGKSTALLVRKKYRALLDNEIRDSLARGRPNVYLAATQGHYIRKAVTIEYSLAQRTYTIDVVSRPTGLGFQPGANGAKCNHFVSVVGGTARSTTRQLPSASIKL